MSIININTIEGNIFPSKSGQTILESALSAGLVFDNNCNNGQCGTCRTTL